MKKLLLVYFGIFNCLFAFGQIGVNTLTRNPLSGRIEREKNIEWVDKQPVPNRISTPRLPAPADECSGATILSVPTGIPTCATIGSVRPDSAVTSLNSATFGTSSSYTTSTTTPLPASGCGFYTGLTQDAWLSLTIPAGASGFQLSLDVTSLTRVGSSTLGYIFAQAYTGTCSALTAVGDCNILSSHNGSTYTDNNEANFTGFTGPQTIYLRIYTYTNTSNASDNWTLGSMKVTLLPPPPANESCSSCSTTLGTGCNLGASPESWAAPTVSTTSTPAGAGVACSGNNWTSVDNPVYYCLTAAATNPTISVSGVACNGGTAGTAQFAAFRTCATVGNYTTTGNGANTMFNNFLGCTSGSGTVSLQVGGTTTDIYPNIISGQSFILVVDGNAGDNCRWSFTSTGLPLVFLDIYGKNEGTVNKLFWTVGESNNFSHFEVERSIEGTNYTKIGEIKEVNNLDGQRFNFTDKYPLSGNNYYRIKVVDLDGSFMHSQIVKVSTKKTIGDIAIQPNPATSAISYSFESREGGDMTVAIFDMTGKLMEQTIANATAGGNTLPLDIQQLPQGIYILQISNATSGERLVQRFVKE